MKIIKHIEQHVKSGFHKKSCKVHKRFCFPKIWNKLQKCAKSRESLLSSTGVRAAPTTTKLNTAPAKVEIKKELPGIRELNFFFVKSMRSLEMDEKKLTRVLFTCTTVGWGAPARNLSRLFRSCFPVKDCSILHQFLVHDRSPHKNWTTLFCGKFISLNIKVETTKNNKLLE